jgi:energy-coupling factor transporter ATP-binding protein EcfA2
MQINFIPDEVLKLNNENDLLGTKPYSDTIFEIVNNCDGKKNIGLFGTWGSGKSTILSTLEDLIEEQNLKIEKKENGKKIAYFEFDSWKYSKDDFRRSFLIELNKKFKIKSQEKLLKLLYSETSVEDPKLTKTKFNWFSLPNWIIFAIAFASVFFYFSPLLDDSNYLKGSISLFVLLISLLATAANNTISKYKVVVKQNKIIEPERFETIFDEIISEITAKSDSSSIVYKWIEKLKNKPKYSKVVIVIDNLDRCDDENLLVTLNTVKNFLEHKKVVFVLPVDEKGISAFLSQKTDNADEYLRKIFHLIIRLKEFSKKELFEFTKKINEGYDLGLTPSSIRIICYEFTSNPRKIIQFLNNYQSEMKLVDEQSKQEYVNGNYIKNNLSFFIKLLIVKYEWKALYDEIMNDRNLLNKINDVITNLEPDEEGLYLIDRTNVKLNDSQRNFFFSTQEIHCNKIDPFVLNIDLDKDIPDEIEDFIRNGNYDEIIGYLDNDETDFDEYKLLQKINEVFSNLTFKHREYSFIALPILKLLMSFILDDKQEKFRDILIEYQKEYIFLKSLFKDKKIVTLFDKFDFEKLTKTTKWFSDNLSDDLFKSFANHLNKTLFNSANTIEKENDKINVFLNVFKGSGKLGIIKNEFSKKILVQPKLGKIDSLKDYTIASQIITPSTYKKLASMLMSDDIDSVQKSNYSNFCMEYLLDNNKDSKTRLSLVKYYINEIEEFYKVEEITEYGYVDYEYYFERLNTLLSVNVGIELSDTFRELLDEFNTHFYDSYDEDFDEDKLLSIYLSFLELIKNLIFNTKDFNQINLRTKYFVNYLEKNFSSKITLKINDILYQDVNRYSAYNYPYANPLIDIYGKTTDRIKYDYAKTVFAMIERSDGEKGVSEKMLDKFSQKVFSNYCFYSFQEQSIKDIKKLKSISGDSLLKVINNCSSVYLPYYVKKVKLLKDNWFFGNTISRFLKEPLSSSDGSYSSFKGRLGVMAKHFSSNEQADFIQEMIKNPDIKTLKWLRLSYSIISKNAYDVYLESLINSHKNKLIGNNNFFEWVVNIPLKHFYKKRLSEYIKYLNDLNITHKTYKPKKERAYNHLTAK